MKFNSLNTPIMLVSDNPALHTGLARMCRDLATLCCTMPEFRVAVLGRGIGQRRRLPFITYDYPETGQWGEGYIQQAWEDFSEGENGIIMTLDDASRRHWFANPTGLPEDLARFLGPHRNFQKWGYFPVDGSGPDSRLLPLAHRDCIQRYDRVLGCTEWGASMLTHSGAANVDWLPHGIFTETFKPQGPSASALLDWEGNVVVGCVMANQARKDYPAAFRAFSDLQREFGNRFRAWVHTDEMVRYWNIPALAAEYGVGDCLEVTMGMPDAALALRYSACAATMLPSGGEGFGYPIVESQACGTACVVTKAAGGAELSEYTVPPSAYRVDTVHSVARAVISGGFSDAVADVAHRKLEDWDGESKRLSERVSYLDWKLLKHQWLKWLRGGLK